MCTRVPGVSLQTVNASSPQMRSASSILESPPPCDAAARSASDTTHYETPVAPPPAAITAHPLAGCHDGRVMLQGRQLFFPTRTRWVHWVHAPVLKYDRLRQPRSTNPLTCDFIAILEKGYPQIIIHMNIKDDRGLYTCVDCKTYSEKIGAATLRLKFALHGMIVSAATWGGGVAGGRFPKSRAPHSPLKICWRDFT